MARDKQKWAAYMREYRKLKPPPKKRPCELDRSKPKGENVKLDFNGYMRQYMRWKRAQAKLGAGAEAAAIDEKEG